MMGESVFSNRKGTKISYTAIGLSLKERLTKPMLAFKGKFTSFLKFLAYAVIGMTRGTSLSTPY